MLVKLDISRKCAGQAIQKFSNRYYNLLVAPKVKDEVKRQGVHINNLPLVKEIMQQEWENATPEIQDEIKKDVMEEKELIAKLKGVKPGNVHLSPEQKALYVISVEVIIYMTTDLLAVY